MTDPLIVLLVERPAPWPRRPAQAILPELCKVLQWHRCRPVVIEVFELRFAQSPCPDGGNNRRTGHCKAERYVKDCRHGNHHRFGNAVKRYLFPAYFIALMISVGLPC